MSMSINFERGATGVIMVAVVAALVMAAQNGNAVPVAAQANAAAVVSSPPAAAAPAQQAADLNGCDTQHWPYYSSECLKGNGQLSQPRTVSLQASDVAVAEPSLDLSAITASAKPAASALKETETEPAAAPRQRKPRHAERPVRRARLAVRRSEPRLVQQTENRFAAPAAFDMSW